MSRRALLCVAFLPRYVNCLNSGSLFFPRWRPIIGSISCGTGVALGSNIPANFLFAAINLLPGRVIGSPRSRSTRVIALVNGHSCSGRLFKCLEARNLRLEHGQSAFTQLLAQLLAIQ